MHIRIETAYDDASGLYYAEVYMPGDAVKPRMVSRPRFRTHEEAMEEMASLIEEGFKKPVRVINPN